jgi:hypothetical protein
MKKVFRFLTVCFYHRFFIIKSCEEAKERGLKFHHNVYGRGASNVLNCRSLWHDEYNYIYKCDELHKNI